MGIQNQIGSESIGSPTKKKNIFVLQSDINICSSSMWQNEATWKLKKKICREATVSFAHHVASKTINATKTETQIKSERVQKLLNHFQQQEPLIFMYHASR